jgi:hypothetical protein
MAGNGAPGSVLGVAMRVCRLDAAGFPIAGANNLYVTNNYTKLDMKPVMQAGLDLSQTNAAGATSVSWRTNDTLKRVDLTLELTVPDPELEELLGVDANPNGVGLELWSRAVKNGSPYTVPYRRWVIGRAFFVLADRTIDASPLTVPLEGYCNENPNFGNGPLNDWSLGSSRCVQEALDPTVPTVADGYQSTPAQT